MFSEQTSNVFAIISIILGIAGIITAHYVVGGPLSVIGIWLYAISIENCGNKITPIIGAIVSIIGIAWFALLCLNADRFSGISGLF